jgi:Leucine-rich repeat (LRR) protein
MMRRVIAIFAIASAAMAAVDSNWIELAGGFVTRDAGGKIVAVDLRSSWVTDSDMPRLAELPELKRLNLSLTRISDRGLRALKSAPGIEELNLYFAEQITDEGTAVVKGWKHLKSLDLRGTKITDSTLEFLAGVPTIERLDIGWAQITDTGLDHLTPLSNLRRLTMGGNKLTDNALQFLRQMPQIEYLDIGGTQRTDSGLWSLLLSRAGMQAIATVTELRELRMAGTPLTSQGLELLAPLTKLERLNLQGCRQLKDDAATILASFKHLRTLDLKDSGMSEKAVAQLRAALPETKVLY